MKNALYISKSDMDSTNLSRLPIKQQNEILAIKDKIVLNYDTTLNYASPATKSISNFSNELLQTVKVKDTPGVEGLITELMTGLSEVDASTLLQKKPSLFKKIFKIDEVKNFITRYDDVSSVIAEVRKKLEQSEFQLKKDVELCDRYLQQNLEYISELDKYIMAGKLKLQEEQNKIEIEEANIDMDDRLAIHQLAIVKGEVDRFDRKLYDLTLMREIAIQNIPQIMLIKQGDAVLVEKIQSSIDSSIPLWESQMAIAITLMRQQGALAIQKGMTNATNNLLSKNSELLKTSSIEIAKQLEAGIVDVEVLKKSGENLITTLKEIRAAREDGKRQRDEAVKQLAQIQYNLNNTLLLESANINI